jgi:hypothetical protein
VLAGEALGQVRQELATPRDEDQIVLIAGEATGKGGPKAGRGAGDEGEGTDSRLRGYVGCV